MRWSTAGAAFLASAVVLGAFAAHGLKGRLDAYSMDVWEKAVFYQFVHSIGLLVVPLFARVKALSEKAARTVCLLLMVGIVFFSGSLYVLALTGVAVLGAVTPLGGLCFIGAWLWLTVSLARQKA